MQQMLVCSAIGKRQGALVNHLTRQAIIYLHEVLRR